MYILRKIFYANNILKKHLQEFLKYYQKIHKKMSIKVLKNISKILTNTDKRGILSIKRNVKFFTKFKVAFFLRPKK